MRIQNVIGSWHITARVIINNKTHYLYRSHKDKQTAINNMFLLIASHQ